MKEKTFHRLFTLGIAIKGINGLLETVGGLAMFFIQGDRLLSIVHFFTRHSLAVDPGNRVANFILKIAQNLSINTEVFVGIYLLGHGLVKLLLVWGLLGRRRWAYPCALWVLSALIIYQVGSFMIIHSFAILFFLPLDIGIIFLIWHEYGVLKREPDASAIRCTSQPAPK